MAEYKYKHRAGTLTQWATPNDGPPLRGEIGVLLDAVGVPLLAKMGDGITPFAELPAIGGYATIVDHGADATAARPGLGLVPILWRGSVEPTNALAGYDDWLSYEA